LTQPNIIIFLTDDQGYGDLSGMGNTDFRTPNLDRLAASGVRFTNWYSNSPVCSPSRAALLTGRYPGNAGVRSILAGHRTASGLPAQTATIAAALKRLGYQTGMTGKWHLGLADGCRPHQHGFDDWFGFLAGCVDYYSHIFYWGMARGGAANNPVHDLWHNNQEIWENGGYITEMISERAARFIRQAANSEAPFFLYVPFNAPHYPMHAPQKYVDRFPDLPWDRQIMAAMLSAVDDSVGDILDELERQSILDHTFIFFMSDNGPSRETRNWLDGTVDPYYGGTAGKLKGHKFSLFEGGIRVPGIMSWPAHIPAGQVIDAPCAAMDIFPTVLTAGGGDPADYELDGTDLLPLVASRQPLPERDLFWEMGQQTAIRRGPWKLVLNGQLIEEPGYSVQDANAKGRQQMAGTPKSEAPIFEEAVFLSNLDNDLGERTNLKDQNPDLTADLTAAAEGWRARIEARWQAEWLPAINGTTTHPDT
jgi:arylsulfatase A-like enzyme